MIHFIEVDKCYEKNWFALKDINFHLTKGEFIFLIGPSGAGKSTILNLITMQTLPTHGQVVVGNYRSNQISYWKIPYLRRQLGVIFQDFKLLNDRTVFENVAFVLEVVGKSRSDIWKQSLKALTFVGLNHKRNEMPLHLSGGEQQRAAIARAIVNDPVILLADEPTGNLDPLNAENIMDILLKINFAGTTVIMATHNYDLVRNYPFRIIALDQGKMVDTFRFKLEDETSQLNRNAIIDYYHQKSMTLN